MAKDTIALLKNKYQGKKILVVGLGLQGGGVGIAKFFCELGAKVTVTDRKNDKALAESIEALKGFPINFHLAGHSIDHFLDSDVIFKGPSVPWKIPEILAAEKKGIPVEMELSFFLNNFSGKVIGITGTRGKSTTTNLIFNVLQQSGFPVHLGGGLPGISTINFLKNLTEKDWVVMEMSSWALSAFHKGKISPHIAVFTSFYPDHLNYYRSMDDYLLDKQAIYHYQKKDDYLVINDKLKTTVNSEVLHQHVIFYSKSDFPKKPEFLRGEHNLENAAAALKVAEILKINNDKAIKIISEYKGLPFRQEIVGEKDNITFINDTTSTTPIATIKAIESFGDRPIYLILGGNSKNLPSEILVKYLEKVRKIILLSGSFTDEFAVVLQDNFKDKILGPYDNLEKAIKKAYVCASAEIKPSYLLFSPGATSFSMFDNEFHRGREFNRIVAALIKSKN